MSGTKTMEASLSQLRRQATSGLEASDPLEESLPPEYINSANSHAHRSFKSIRRIRREQQDQDLLHRTLQDACRYSYGTKMVEVWVWDSLHSKLTRPEGGWWLDPYWQSDDMAVFCQFVDTQRHDYIAPPEVCPGVGVPGVLWADLGRNRGANRQGKRRTSTMGGGGGGGGASGMMDNAFLAQIFDDNHYFASRIAWRDLKALANDPDQPYNKRLEVLASTDLKWTAGVPFSIHGQEGIVIYYAREGVNLQKLQDPTNTDYLMTASDFVGSCLALRTPRRHALQRRQREVDRTIRKVKWALQKALRCGATLESIASGHYDYDKASAKEHHHHTCKHHHNEQHPHDTPLEALEDQMIVSVEKVETCTIRAVKFAQRKTKQSAVKFWGAGNKLPPPSAWDMSVFNTMGVLASIFLIGALRDLLLQYAGPDYGFPMGPIAALLALQFGLTAAPAAQPRTILVGQVASLFTALALAHLDLPESQRWMQQCTAVALSIGLMAKIGVVNPPAAANTYLFASGDYGLSNLGMALIANTIAILCATFLNNLLDNRIYPTSWGLPEACLSNANFQRLMDTDRDDTATALLRRSTQVGKGLTKQMSSSFLRQLNQNNASVVKGAEPTERANSNKDLLGNPEPTVTAIPSTSNIPMDEDHHHDVDHGESISILDLMPQEDKQKDSQPQDSNAPAVVEPIYEETGVASNTSTSDPKQDSKPQAPAAIVPPDVETGVASNSITKSDAYGVSSPTVVHFADSAKMGEETSDSLALSTSSRPNKAGGRHRRTRASMSNMFI